MVIELDKTSGESHRDDLIVGVKQYLIHLCRLIKSSVQYRLKFSELDPSIASLKYERNRKKKKELCVIHSFLFPSKSISLIYPVLIILFHKYFFLLQNTNPSRYLNTLYLQNPLIHKDSNSHSSIADIYTTSNLISTF